MSTDAIVKIQASYVKVSPNGTVVVIGTPTEQHDCDMMGCSSVEHVVIRGIVPTWLVKNLFGVKID